MLRVDANITSPTLFVQLFASLAQHCIRKNINEQSLASQYWKFLHIDVRRVQSSKSTLWLYPVMDAMTESYLFTNR
jgi:hypothetical protein